MGKGSFGVVYKALHAQTGYFAAIKLLNPHSLKFEQVQKEINILRKVDHPNIIKYLDCSNPSDRAEKSYIIFEFIESGSLKDVIKKFGVFSEQLARKYVFQVISQNNQKNFFNVIKNYFR